MRAFHHLDPVGQPGACRMIVLGNHKARDVRECRDCGLCHARGGFTDRDDGIGAVDRPVRKCSLDGRITAHRVDALPPQVFE